MQHKALLLQMEFHQNAQLLELTECLNADALVHEFFSQDALELRRTSNPYDPGRIGSFG